jgi:L-malate glycosyltransferase
MVRICHFIETLNMGGLEMVVKNIALNLDRTKYYQEVWCLKDKGELAQDIERAGITVRPFHFKGRLDIRCLLRLIRALKEKRFDVIHSHGFFSIIWGVPIGFLAGIRIRIGTCGNCYHGISQKIRLKFRLIGYFATHFTAFSDAVRRSVVECVGVPSSKVSVVYNSSGRIEPKGFEEKKKICDKMGIKDTDFILVSVSRLVGHKGHNYMIEALSMLKPHIHNIKYIIVGDGPAKDALQAQAKALGLENAVIFTGLKHDVTDFLGIADVFVQPSALREGLPLALTEGASVGLPMVATDIGGNCEIVADGVNGFIVAPRNAALLAEKILYLAENPGKRKVMSDNARAVWQEKFTLEKMLDEYAAIYKTRV